MLKLLIYSLLLTTSASHASTLNCSDIGNLSDLLGFISKQHPDIEYLNDIDKNNGYLIEVAKQRPNPKLSLQYDTRKNETQRVHNTELSILHTFELGSKRSARINLAKNQRNFLAIRINEQLEDIYISTIIDYFKYQHHKKLISNLEEAIKTFKEIIKIKTKRQFLSPEDSAQLVAMEIAEKDYELKIKNLHNQNEQIQLSFDYIFNKKCNIEKLALDDNIHQILEDNISQNISNDYSKSLKVQRQYELAQANVDYQESLAYTDIMIGPFVTINNQNQGQDTSVGVALNVALPIYHTNKAARRKSAEMLEISKRYKGKIRGQISNTVLKLQSQYKSAKINLKNSISEKELTKKHQEMDKLFKRGIVSTSSMIEVHRQIIEYDLNKHEEEEQMLEAVLKLKVINGTLLSKKVKK